MFFSCFIIKRKKKKHGATAERKKERTCIEEGRKRKNNQNKFGVNKPNINDKKVKQNQKRKPLASVCFCFALYTQWTIHRQRKCISSRTDIRNIEQTTKNFSQRRTKK
jgi:hypothetical protein